MIPEAAILDWRAIAPWNLDAQVEQDLILSRALIEIFQEPLLASSLIVRGGTALQKLYLTKAERYSEDIDLVQESGSRIGPTLDAIRKRLDPILGVPRRENNPDNVTLRYRIESEIQPVVPIRLKVEINTREHFNVFGTVTRSFKVRSPWVTSQAEVRTFLLEELLATKLRALYQRRKGRDLFDLWIGLTALNANPKKILDAFKKYMKAEGKRITGNVFEKNLSQKLLQSRFHDDLRPLLPGKIEYDPEAAARLVNDQLLFLL